MSNDLVKVCKSSDEAKVQRKIFLVSTNFIDFEGLCKRKLLTEEEKCVELLPEELSYIKAGLKIDLKEKKGYFTDEIREFVEALLKKLEAIQ